MLNDLRISTKLVGALAVVAVAAMLAVGWFVMRGAERALRDQAISRLDAERDSRARLVTAYFERVHKDLLVAPRLLVTQTALREMPDAIRSGFPANYDRLDAMFHPVARGKMEAFGYRDVFLVAVDGTVLYSSLKEIGFATNLRTGAFRETGLGKAFAGAAGAPAGAVRFVDFAPYAPGSGVAAAFIGTPVFDPGTTALLGVFVYELPVDEIDAIMSDVTGFGDSGETYLLGADRLLRTNRRGDRQSVLRPTADTEAVRRALSGATGAIDQQNDRGVPVISSFAPIAFEGLHWAVLAEANLRDILAPAAQFQSRVVLLLSIVALLSAVVMWTAMRRIVLEPVAALAAGARRVASLDYTRPVSLESRDELGLLGQAFDGMMASVGSQIDDLKAVQRNLAESEERLSAAASGANLGLWEVEPPGDRTLANSIYESQLGYPPLALRETDAKWAPLRGGLAAWADMLHPDDREAVEDQIRRYFAGELDVYKAEHRVRTGDGSHKWILSVGRSAGRDASGRPTRVNGVHIDISEMKGLQLDLRLRYEELQRLEQLRDGLVHMIVHDLRSPLTSVMGYIDLLRTETTASADDRATFIDAAYTSAAQMVEMVSSLLDVNRLEAGEMPVDRQQVDLCDVAATAVRSLGGLTLDRNVTHTAPDGCVASSCDPVLIRRVVANLVANALKFTPESGAITVTVSRVGGRPQVAVADTGPGIPPDFVSRVFDKFSQAGAGRAQKRYSTGVGLSFCKLAVEAHGGTIGVESEVGAGSRFWFQLPA